MNKEFLKNELIFRAICAYSENGISNCSYNELSDVAGRDLVQMRLKLLEVDNKIKKISKNGFMPRYKILVDELPCPDFIFNKNINIDDKLLLLLLYSKVSSYTYMTKSELSPIIETTSANISRLVSRVKKRYNLEWYEILNKTSIVKKVLDTTSLIDTDAGFQYKTEKADKVYLCKYCGETNPDNFYAGSACMCKKCKNQRDKERNTIEHSLYLRTINSFKQRNILEHSITENDIIELLKNQKNKCYYTGVEFANNDKDKIHYPTVDRIDSNKGYTPDNIVICSWRVNSMKNDMTVEEFKNLIELLYQNKDNF